MTDNEIRSVVQDLNQRDLLELVQREAKRRHVTVHEVIGKYRFRPAEEARHAVWHELFDSQGWPIATIARVLHRDRRCVRNGIEAHLQRAAKGQAA